MKRNSRHQKLSKAIQQLREETDIVRMIRSMRFFEKAIESLLDQNSMLKFKAEV